MDRRSFVVGTAATAAALATPAMAQDAYPSRAVTFINPFPPGGAVDVVARPLAAVLEPILKQPVVIETKAGAGGLIGMDAVAKAPADGYTLGIGFNGPIAFGPFMYKHMAYDPVKDLQPIVLATSQPNVLAVQASNPAHNLPEFIAWAKAQGDRLSYASVGNGSSSQLTAELFDRETGIRAVHVPYNGSPPAAGSVAGGDTQMVFATAPALLPLAQAGRLKLLAVTSLQRLPAMKDLPTVAEQGLPGFEALAWNGFFAPAAMPPALADRINADVNAVLKEPEVREALAKQGLIVGGGSAAEFKAMIAADAKKWGALIVKAGIKLD